MIQVLIADDERLIRLTIRSMLEEICPGELSFYEAEDGTRMTEVMEEHPIDIVFLDIHMPGENGLEAMARLKTHYPDTIWCILTGYDYFSYAKQALEQGVMDYLLKPPDPEELRKFMDRAKKRLADNFRMKHERMEQGIRDGCYVGDFDGSQLPDGEYTLYVLCVDSADARTSEACSRNLYAVMEKKYLEEKRDFAVFFWTGGELCLLIDGGRDDEIGSVIQRGEVTWSRKVWVTGLSQKIADPGGVRQAIDYLTAMDALRLYLADKTVMDVSELEKVPDILTKRYFCEQLEKMTTAYLEGDAESCSLYCAKLRDEKNFADESLYTETLGRHISLIWGTPLDISSKDSFYHDLAGTARNKHQNHGDGIVDSIEQFVQRNYMDDVSISRAADLCGISPTYLSRVFREKTGKKYIDYVTEVRMKKAKDLLESGEYKVKDISSMTGYMSEKHFSRTFKKYYGISPSQINKA